MRIETGELCLRTLEVRNDDLDHILRWLTDDEILRYFDGRDHVRSRAEVQAEFAPNADGGPFMIEHRRQPVGFLDIFQFTNAQKTRHGISDVSEPVWAFDIVIGEVSFQSQGIGRQAIMMILPLLFEQFQAQRVVLDTYTWNTRAIRCYEQCGFTITCVLHNHDVYEGTPVDDVFMEIDRATFYSGIET